MELEHLMSNLPTFYPGDLVKCVKESSLKKSTSDFNLSFTKVYIVKSQFAPGHSIKLYNKDPFSYSSDRFELIKRTKLSMLFFCSMFHKCCLS